MRSVVRLKQCFPYGNVGAGEYNRIQRDYSVRRSKLTAEAVKFDTENSVL